MKEHVQKPGVRKWAGEDLIELQGESLTAIQALVEPYAPCIVQGCEVSHENGVYQVKPGIVALKGSNEDGNACTKIVRFAGYSGEVLPIYLTIKVTPYMRVYADEENKPIAYEYTAEPDTNQPAVPYLKIEADGGKRLVDTIGITQKLDREGGNASNVKVMSFTTDNAATLTNIAAGITLKELFGRIKRWLSELGKLAFKDTVGASDFDADLTDAFNNKVDKDGTKVLSEVDFTQAHKEKLEGIDKTKLDGIEEGANKYTHPTSAAGAKTSGFYKIETDANGHITAVTSVTKEDITGLGIPEKDTVYTHPTAAGYKHIPSGGSSGQYLKRGISSGIAVWATPTASEIGAAAESHSHDAATQSDAGFMSADDKKKLDGITAGANKYTHPASAAGAKTSGLYKITTDANGHITAVTSVTKEDITGLGIPEKDTVYTHPTAAGNKHIPSGGSSGQYLKYSSAGTAQWASPASNLATTYAAGFMSADDKKKVDGAYIYYMAKVECNSINATVKYAYNPAGIAAKFEITKDSNGNAICKASVGRPSGYSYVRPLILGNSSGAAWIGGETGYGDFNVYITGINSIGAIINGGFNIVLIAHS